MKYDFIFDSSVRNYEEKYIIDYEKDTPVVILFEKENITLIADRHGNATFLNSDADEVFKSKAESNKYFSSIYCIVRKNTINIRFPITKTVDNYPNCDGEYDRWDEIITDNINITFTIAE